MMKRNKPADDTFELTEEQKQAIEAVNAEHKALKARRQALQAELQAFKQYTLSLKQQTLLLQHSYQGLSVEQKEELLKIVHASHDQELIDCFNEHCQPQQESSVDHVATQTTSPRVKR